MAELAPMNPNEPSRLVIGARIREAREKAGRSQEWLAAVVGVSKSKIIRWENGTGDPSYTEMIRVSHSLEQSLTWFADGAVVGQTPRQIDDHLKRLLRDHRERLAEAQREIDALLLGL